MTAEGHILFAIASAILAKRGEYTPVLAAADWWHLIPAALTTCLLPDIDHPKSLLGQRLRFLSIPVARMFGHRGFTHSLIAVVLGLALLQWKFPASCWLPADVVQGMIIGYLSHICADMLTPAGVPLLWPCRWRICVPVILSGKSFQPERYFCLLVLSAAIFIPEHTAKNALDQGFCQLSQVWQQWTSRLSLTRGS